MNTRRTSGARDERAGLQGGALAADQGEQAKKADRPRVLMRAISLFLLLFSVVFTFGGIGFLPGVWDLLCRQRALYLRSGKVSRRLPQERGYWISIRFL
jgi:hypothetical protein